MAYRATDSDTPRKALLIRPAKPLLSLSFLYRFFLVFAPLSGEKILIFTVTVSEPGA